MLWKTFLENKSIKSVSFALINTAVTKVSPGDAWKPGIFVKCRTILEADLCERDLTRMRCDLTSGFTSI